MFNDADVKAIREKIIKLSDLLDERGQALHYLGKEPFIVMDELKALVQYECCNYEDCLHNNMALGCSEAHRKEIKRCPYKNYKCPTKFKSKPRSYKDKLDFKEKADSTLIYSKDMIRFARQFGYDKAIELFKIWEDVKFDIPNFIIKASRMGITQYAYSRFIDASKGEY